MTNEEKQKVVTDYLQASLARDPEQMGKHLTEDFTVWLAPSAREQGFAAKLESRAQFFDLIGKLRERPDMWKVRQFLPQQFLFSDDSVAVRVRSVGDFPSGFVYDNEYVFIYRLRDGKICEMREFTDVAYINSLRKQAMAQAAG
jgi:ketosteroid isomerase-like protein